MALKVQLYGGTYINILRCDRMQWPFRPFFKAVTHPFYLKTPKYPLSILKFHHFDEDDKEHYVHYLVAN